MALTNLADLKTHLGIRQTNTVEDPLLTMLITQISAMIEEWCGRKFAQDTLTEYYSGRGTPDLILNRTPVTSITSLYVDQNGFWGDPAGSFNSTLTVLTEGNDFALDRDQPDGTSLSGIVVKIDDVWPRPITRNPGILSPGLGRGNGNIKVIYTGGYATTPPDVEWACNFAIAKARMLGPYGQLIGSESYEERSISFVTGNRKHLLAEVTPILAKYKRITFGR